MKKVISGMLALVMMLCIMSVSVMAAEYVLDGGFEGYASNWTTTRDALKNYGTENLYCNSNVGTLAIDTVNVKTGSQSLKMARQRGPVTASIRQQPLKYASLSFRA